MADTPGAPHEGPIDAVSFEHLRVSVAAEGRTVVVELDHGKANEMGTAQLAEFELLCGAIEADPRPSVLITFSRRRTTKGTPIFVAGANVTERAGWDTQRVLQHVRWQRSVLARLRHLPLLHIVVVDGIALGWGTEFQLTASVRIAGNGAVFGLPETGIGIVPGAGGIAELASEIGVGNALRLGMTGERIGADEALRIGLVHERVTDVDTGLARAHAIAAQVQRRSPTAVAAFKHGVLAAVGASDEVREAIEDAAYTWCVDTGEAGIGRANFDVVGAGGTPPWGPRRAREG